MTEILVRFRIPCGTFAFLVFPVAFPVDVWSNSQNQISHRHIRQRQPCQDMDRAEGDSLSKDSAYHILNRCGSECKRICI